MVRKAKNRVKISPTDPNSTTRKAWADNADTILNTKMADIEGFGQKITENMYYRYTKDQLLTIIDRLLTTDEYTSFIENKLTVFNALCVKYIILNVPSIKYISTGWDGKTK